MRNGLLPRLARIAAGLAMAIGFVGVMAPTASAEPDYVKELRSRFGPSVSDDDLRTLLAGPSGEVWRATVDSARMGEALYSGQDELQRATLDLYGHVASEVFNTFGWGTMIKGLGKFPAEVYIVNGSAHVSRWPLALGIVTTLNGAAGTLHTAQSNAGLVEKFAAVYIERLNRQLLQEYAGGRLTGQSPADAWDDIDNITSNTGIVASICNMLGIPTSDYPRVLEDHYQLLRFSKDQELIEAIRAGLESRLRAARRLPEQRRPAEDAGPAPDLQLVNTGPLDVKFTLLDGDHELASRTVSSDNSAVLHFPGTGWAAATDVRVDIADLGTFKVPAGQFNTSLWYDPLSAFPSGDGGFDLSVDRVRSANPGTPQAPAPSHLELRRQQAGTATPAGTVRHAYPCPRGYLVKATIKSGPYTESPAGHDHRRGLVEHPRARQPLADHPRRQGRVLDRRAPYPRPA